MIKTNIDITPIKFDFSKNVELFDYIKGWSILFVILTHCWPRSFRSHILFFQPYRFLFIKVALVQVHIMFQCLSSTLLFYRSHFIYLIQPVKLFAFVF